MSYKPQKIELKWQKYWEENGFYRAEDFSKKTKKYILIEFPYPSGEGLHVGHVRSYAALDALSRKKRMEGFNVLFPIGWDAFGLPTENYAIKTGVHPKEATKNNVSIFKRQLKSLGLSFDWSREINTTDPEYYKWTQWIFLKLFEKGLAYQAEIPVNWCPSCKIGLANEEVVDGNCERCGTEAGEKTLKQWMIKITAYADRLLKDLEGIDYPEKIKAQQRNWIGRSEGTEIIFKLKEVKKQIPVVTTRPDTIFGATFLVLAPEHRMIEELKNNIKNYEEVEKYIKKSVVKSEFERGLLAKEKTGVKLEGLTAVNPANNKEIPIYVSDFVLVSYGTGAIMSVPAHDNRDFEFSKKFNIPIIEVIERSKKQDVFSIFIYDNDRREAAQKLRDIGKSMEYVAPNVRTYNFKTSQAKQVTKILKSAKIGTSKDYELIVKSHDFDLEQGEKPLSFVMVYMGDGRHVNSGFINGLNNEKAIKKMVDWLSQKKIGRSVVHYHLRDWVFSRQHYWGEPIPIIHCEKCGQVPVSEKDLPVELPYVEKYQPTGTGESPLAAISEWVNVKCPECKGEAKRETDTMPNWAGSNWYYMRYCDPDNQNELADKKKLEYWLPVDWYNGGMEHTTLHLLYSRFIYKFLFDIKFAPTAEPYKRRTSHGIILAEDNRKMSKSFGNVVNPDEIVKKFGADSLRMYEMFMGPFDQAISWSGQGVRGVYRFLEKTWKLVLENLGSEKTGPKIESALHKLNKKINEDLESAKFNTIVSAFMEFVNLAQQEGIGKKNLKRLVILLSPFAPHISEELWEKIGNKNSVFLEKWPDYDKELIKEEKINLVVQINGKVRGKIEVKADISEKEAKALAISDKKIENWISGKDIKKVVFVPGKLINLVI